MQVRRVTGVFPEFSEPCESIAFHPNRGAGLKRLEQFLTRTGRHYANTRNYDYGAEQRGNVSCLSPWLRHRLVTEQEVLTRVLAAQSPSAAEKFIQEVFWRAYFKGWLEQRPSVWTHYQRELIAAFDRLETDAALLSDFTAATSGLSGIDCFDHWARELVVTGYLHNHARMWFASIWIFTLRLPWQLGADFFLRHLLDGDPASNTLSWRWVAGLHTKGKTYLARADNIAKYTDGRFQPKGLAKDAVSLNEPFDHPRQPITELTGAVEAPFLLLLTEDDVRGDEVLDRSADATIGLLATHGRSPKPLGQIANDFSFGAMSSVLHPKGHAAQSAQDWFAPLYGAARQAGVTTIATAHVPVGPARARLDQAEPKLMEAGITLKRVMRPYDRIVWPHAKTGFFGLKKQIPTILHQLQLSHSGLRN